MAPLTTSDPGQVQRAGTTGSKSIPISLYLDESCPESHNKTLHMFKWSKGDQQYMPSLEME